MQVKTPIKSTVSLSLWRAFVYPRWNGNGSLKGLAYKIRQVGRITRADAVAPFEAAEKPLNASTKVT